MEPNLHLQQGLILLKRVLEFYPVMREGNVSTVTLSDQDWIVLMDFIGHPDSAPVIPDAVREISFDRETREIAIKTSDCVVKVVMGF